MQHTGYISSGVGEVAVTDASFLCVKRMALLSKGISSFGMGEQGLGNPSEDQSDEFRSCGDKWDRQIEREIELEEFKSLNSHW